MPTIRPWLLATMLLAGCEQSGSLTGPAAREPSLARTAEHFTETHPIQAIVTNPCNGEDIALVGVARNTTVTVSEPGNTDHTVVDGIIKGTGTGLTSGVTYRFVANFHFSFQTPNLPSPNATTFTHDQLNVVSLGSEENFFFSFDVHVVFNSHGVKTTVENFTGECRG